jgi:hypothetical protein
MIGQTARRNGPVGRSRMQEAVPPICLDDVATAAIDAGVAEAQIDATRRRGYNHRTQEIPRKLHHFLHRECLHIW